MNRSIVKRAVTVFTLAFFMLTMMGFNFSSASGTDAVKKKILIVSPHEDDESITCAGVIKSAVDRGDDIRVMYVSNGDWLDLAEKRAGEAVTAMGKLGLSKDKLYYLSYGDYQVLDGAYLSKDNPTTVFYSHYGQGATYGTDAIENYHQSVYGAPASYCRQNILSDMQDVINKFRPDDIYMPSSFETNLDHKAVSLFTTEAIMNIKKSADFSPVIHEFFVYKYGLPQEGVDYSLPPVPFSNDTANMDYTSPYNWADRESVPVPAEMSALSSYLNRIDLLGEGAQITINGQAGSDIDIKNIFDEDVWSSYLSDGIKDNTTITVAFPNKENIERLRVLTGEVKPASTFITVEAADTPEDLANKGNTYKLIQEFESTEADWDEFPVNAACNLKIWKFTFHTNAEDNIINVRLINFLKGNFKAAILRDYESQFGNEKWAMADEIFWKKKLSSLSYSAVASASSENLGMQQSAVKVIDGVVLGDGIYKYRWDAYWQDTTRSFNYDLNIRNTPFEWVIKGEAKNAWIKLKWKNPVTANRIILYDRPDMDENILSARLTFNDGTPIYIGPLNKNGSGTVIDFKTRTFDEVKLTVEDTEGASTGLTEFEVYNMP